MSSWEGWKEGNPLQSLQQGEQHPKALPSEWPPPAKGLPRSPSSHLICKASGAGSVADRSRSGSRTNNTMATSIQRGPPPQPPLPPAPSGSKRDPPTAYRGQHRLHPPEHHRLPSARHRLPRAAAVRPTPRHRSPRPAPSRPIAIATSHRRQPPRSAARGGRGAGRGSPPPSPSATRVLPTASPGGGEEGRMRERRRHLGLGSP